MMTFDDKTTACINSSSTCDGKTPGKLDVDEVLVNNRPFEWVPALLTNHVEMKLVTLR